MKIDKTNNSLPLTSNSEAKGRTSVTKSGGQPPASVPSSTSVNLGSTTTQMRSMGGSLSTTPLVNATKVAEIKQAISEGRFQVNSSAVADSLIKSVTDLISSQR